MNERSISIRRMDVGPAKRVNVTVTPTSFSLAGLDELIGQLQEARNGLLGETEAHYANLLAESEAQARASRKIS